MKNAVVHEGAKAMHLTYLGDASIGRDSNIGAGTITCNYDGVAKYETTIGNRVFIGSDTALVAPGARRRWRLRRRRFDDHATMCQPTLSPSPAAARSTNSAGR